jgi:hypothetical protein
MKKIVFIIAILFVEMTAWAQEAKLKDFSVEQAAPESVLVGFNPLSEYEILVSKEFSPQEADEYVEKFLSNLIRTNQWQSNFYLRKNLPPPSELLGFGNGTAVVINGDTLLLTAKHCLDSLSVSMAILGADSSDIALLAISGEKITVSQVSFEKMKTGKKCSFSFFHTLGTPEWKFRTVTGVLTELPVSVLDSLGKGLTENLEPLLIGGNDKISYLKEVFKVNGEILISETPEKIIREIAEIKFNGIKKQLGELLMEISPEIYRNIEGASGSAMRNEKGEVVAVATNVVSLYGRYYVIFESVRTLTE